MQHVPGSVRGPAFAVALIATALFGTACHKDSTAPRTATSVSLLKGAGVQLVAGSAATDTMSVVVTSSDGQTVSGVTVTWVLTQGDGVLSATSSVSDASGVASVVYTAGSSAEEVAVTATVTGLTPVMITLDQVAAASPSRNGAR